MKAKPLVEFDGKSLTLARRPIRKGLYDMGVDSFKEKDTSMPGTFAKLRRRRDEGLQLPRLSYAQGSRGGRDPEKAHYIYQKAATKGTVQLRQSGSLYQDAGDTDQARKYFQKACKGGRQWL